MMMIMLANDAIFWGGAIFAAVCGGALLAWALFADRSRGRRRCGKCWYRMDHAASLRCPECGHEAKHDRALCRTRRRWKWAAVSCLPLLLAAYLAMQPKVQRDGWGSVMPATALIVLLRVDDSQWVLDGIEYHISEFSIPTEEQLWRWQWAWLARSVLLRVEDEARVSQRMAYHAWLSVSADAGIDPLLRQACMNALIRDMAHTDRRVRQSAAIYSIDYEDIDGSISRAVALLDHADAHTRGDGVMILRIISTRTGHGIPALIEALQHEDAVVRMSALAAIGATARRYGPVPEAYDPVYALEHDDDGGVRDYRVQTLADLQSDADAWNTIDTALRHDDPHVRLGGLNAVLDRNPRPAHISTRIIECLGDPDEEVRMYAAFELEHIDTEVLQQHAALLDSFLHHDDPTVRKAVARVKDRYTSDE